MTWQIALIENTNDKHAHAAASVRVMNKSASGIEAPLHKSRWKGRLTLSQFCLLAPLVAALSIYSTASGAASPVVSQERGWATEQVSIGDVPILVPIPPAHVGGERVPKIVRQSNNPRNELLAVYIRYVDAVLASRAVPTTFKTVYRVEVLKKAIGTKVTRHELATFKRDLRSGFLERHSEALVADSNRINAAQRKDLSDYVGQVVNRISIGKLENLGVFDEGPDWVSVLLLTKAELTVGGQVVTQPMIFTINTLIIRDRMVTALVTRIYEDDGDLATVVEDSRKWTHQFYLANARPPR